MFFKEWNVLVVDDEPDVLAVSRLALRDVTVYGLPVRIHTARSKREAIELLKGPLTLQGSSQPIVAVALVDVVMENDQAGLELCQYIRDRAEGQAVQLFIRTGQPGLAPERKVIDDYDISGYFTKVELTEEKLYTLVKSGVRQWFTIWYALNLENQTNNLMTHSTSRKDFLEGIGWMGESGPIEGEPVTGLVFDNDLVLSDYRDRIILLHERLDRLKPILRTAAGHKLVMDDRGTVMVKTVKSRTTADYYYIAESTMIMPRLLLDLTFKSGLVFSTLWKKITDEEKKTAAAKKTSRPVKKTSKRRPTKKTVKKMAKLSSKSKKPSKKSANKSRG